MVPVDQTEQTKRPVQTFILYRISIFLVEQFRYISVHKMFIFYYIILNGQQTMTTSISV
jgi:hypothetical protein